MKPLDPILAEIAKAAGSGPSLFALSPDDARAVFDNIVSVHGTPQDDQISAEDGAIQTEAGQLPIRIYRPKQNTFGATIVFLHGGGYMLGGIDQMDGEARLLCGGTESVVVSVGYRLAPEHKLPAAHDDAVSALLWARDQIRNLGGDADKLCVAGESAGANLAASAAIELRDRGVHLCAQLLIVPGPDLAALRDLPDCGQQFPMISCRDVRTIAQICLPDGKDVAAKFPYSAVHAERLNDLPPAVIGIAQHCPTRDIGRAYARRLTDSGNEVFFHCFEDVFHPFYAFAKVSEAAGLAVETLHGELKSILARDVATSLV